MKADSAGAVIAPGPEPEVGDVLGAYRLEALAGEGGMGRVFRAVHVKLNRTVAVKLLRRRYASRPQAIARFFQEARAVNVIGHPNIVEITDFFEAPPGGDSYYIMEWLDGTTLDVWIAKHGSLGGERVREIGVQTASALAAVHKAGLVHRDIKPQNILMREEEDQPATVKLLDFGVAQLLGGGDKDKDAGPATAGTPAYFSPEVAAGRTVDARSDVYSLGCVLYELLVGCPPFIADSFSEYVMRHMTARHRAVKDAVALAVPAGLASAIDRCLEKKPEARFQTMDELRAALVTEEPTRPLAGRPPRRTPYALVASVLVGLALIGGLVYGLARKSETPSTTSSTPAKRSSAADPTPAPPPVDDRVAVTISSAPEGAEVMEGETLLGSTPCTIMLHRSNHTLELRLEGHRSVTRVFDATKETEATIRLEKTRKAAPTKANRNATINPFEN